MDILKEKLPSNVYYRLVEGGIDCMAKILTCDELALQQLTKLNRDQIKLIVQVTAEIIVRDKFRPACQIKRWQRFTTGCSAIDSITHGGIPVNGITEIAGPSGAGKTQLCLQLALTVQFPLSIGGLNKGAVYICTEDRFPSKRLNQLAKMFQVHSEGLNSSSKFEDNVFIDHISDYEQLRRCLYIRLPNLLMQHNIGLIVIDSVAGIFRADTINVNYSIRSQELLTITRQLNVLAKKFDMAIVCINQITDNLLIGKSEPCLGLTWSNSINTRFYMDRLDNRRTFAVVFSPDLPNAKCNLIIKDIGVVDATHVI